MYPPSPLRVVLLLSALLLAACGPSSAESVSPESERDYLGAVALASHFALPSPQHSVGFSGTQAEQEVREPIARALLVLNQLTASKEPTRGRGGLEWRSAPGLADALVYRVVVVNLDDRWSDQRAGFKPSQRWHVRMEVKRRLAPDSEFFPLMESTRNTPEGDWQAERGDASITVDYRGACDKLGLAACRLAGLYNSHGLGYAKVTVATRLDGVRTWEGGVIGYRPASYANSEVSTFIDFSASMQPDGSGEIATSTRYEGPTFSATWASHPQRTRTGWQPDGAHVHKWRGMTSDSTGALWERQGTVCRGAYVQQLYYRETGPQGTVHQDGSPEACPPIDVQDP